MIVVDTNVLAHLLIGGEHTVHARAVLGRDSSWTAPVLWRSEFRNVLARYLKRGELEIHNAFELMELAESRLDGAEFHVDSRAVLRLAESSRCSAYDCEFVALAEELGVPLVTSDGLVLSEFPASAVSPERFAASG